jgi:hypothetical protein
MVVLGNRLMPPAPLRPRQDVVDGVRHGEHQTPQQPANLRDTQGNPRPRLALNAARLLSAWGRGRLFFNASTAIVPARMTVSRANAHIASVI